MGISSGFAVATLLISGVNGPSLSWRTHALIDHPVLLLEDVADLSILPDELRERARSLPIASVRADHGAMRLSDTAILARIRRQMPVLVHWLPEASGVAIAVHYRRASHGPDALSPKNPGRSCLAAVQSLATGEISLPNKFAAAACPERGVRRAFRYDAARGVTQTIRRIHAGEIVPFFAGFDSRSVMPGDRLTLVTMAGPVTVQREVEAMQSAHDGQKLFVRSKDNEVFAVRYRESGQ